MSVPGFCWLRHLQSSFSCCPMDVCKQSYLPVLWLQLTVQLQRTASLHLLLQWPLLLLPPQCCRHKMSSQPWIQPGLLLSAASRAAGHRCPGKHMQCSNNLSGSAALALIAGPQLGSCTAARTHLVTALCQQLQAILPEMLVKLFVSDDGAT